jgi:hypothetical protein
MAYSVLFNSINVNSMQSNAGVFLSSTKSNNGFSLTGDDYDLFRNMSFVKDENGIDIIKSVT